MKAKNYFIFSVLIGLGAIAPIQSYAKNVTITVQNCVPVNVYPVTFSGVVGIVKNNEINCPDPISQGAVILSRAEKSPLTAESVPSGTTPAFCFVHTSDGFAWLPSPPTTYQLNTGAVVSLDYTISSPGNIKLIIHTGPCTKHTSTKKPSK